MNPYIDNGLTAEAKANKDEQLFLANAFLFYKNAQQILTDSRMFFALSPELLNQLNGYLSHIINNGIPAYVILSQLNAAQDLNSTLKSVSGKK